MSWNTTTVYAEELLEAYLNKSSTDEVLELTEYQLPN